jgi:hypothetical protein
MGLQVNDTKVVPQQMPGGANTLLELANVLGVNVARVPANTAATLIWNAAIALVTLTATRPLGGVRDPIWGVRDNAHHISYLSR